MDLAALLAEVDRLRRLPFPARRGHRGTVVSGPGFHLAALAVSEDLHDPHGADPGRAAHAEDDFRAWCQALVELLSARWGEPETLDLYPFLERRTAGGPTAGASPEGRPPPPLDELCGFVPEVYGWRVGDRWTAVGVGQGERGLPLQLVVATADRAVYEQAVAPGPGPTGPRVTDPRTAGPRMSDPSVSDPSVSEPSVSDPSVSEPSVTDPSLTDPRVIGPRDAGARGA
ncbi:hypothetical protein [Streptomyces sp. HPF1205]|uniref:hypothetical protein n=1 Tax=Streptomyces sp. HPF1205 TaxID=2873262 RepID=UPI001CEC40DC|nr:hypothetical protein [Streptomyces sp. HPF1205]